KESSWGAGLVPAVTSPEMSPEVQGDGEWTAETSLGPRRGKSIPASLVDGLKVDSRKVAEAAWSVSPDAWGTGGFQEQPVAVLLEPPTLPYHNPTSDLPQITNDTPLPSLFRLTPELYPAFKDGIASTAVRTAETLRGTSSAAYRNARFGRGTAALWNGAASTSANAGRWDIDSSLSRSERGHAGDEFDIDGPDGLVAKDITKSSWWGPNDAKPAVSSTNMPKSLLVRKSQDEVAGPASPTSRTASPATHEVPSAIGRFFGRFRTSSPQSAPHSRSSSNEEGAEWSGDVSQLERPTRRVAETRSEDGARLDAQLGGLFGDAPAVPQIRPTAQSDFGGLMGGLDSAPVAASNVRRTAKSLDPFDPFGDDEDNDAGIPALDPSPMPRVTSPPINLSSWSTAAVPIQSEATNPTRSFPSLAAPQSVAPGKGEDSFDAFFSSFSPNPTSSTPISHQAVTRPGSATTSVRSVVSPPPRTSTLPPPSRVSTISPPSNSTLPRQIQSSTNPLTRTGTSSPALFAPPPPPIQPVSRGGFNIAPPPPSNSSIASSHRISTLILPPAVKISVASPPVVPRPPPPKTVGSGPLSFDDLSFFEN
ncbi:hypothetical protein P7C70_g7990, partial [Phenoliferia sp. Uapishka_3]